LPRALTGRCAPCCAAPQALKEVNGYTKEDGTVVEPVKFNQARAAQRAARSAGQQRRALPMGGRTPNRRALSVPHRWR
jgi:hypothetical protein